MGVDAPNHPPIAAPPDGEAFHRRRWWTNRAPLLAVLVITLIGVAGVVYDVLAPTTEEPLDARSHAGVAHACDAAYRTLKALPPLTHTSTRSELAARTELENGVFATMVATFDRIRPTDRDGRTALRDWTADWRAVIRRRADYVRGLRTTSTHVDLVIPIDKAGGAPVTDRMNQYSRTHSLNQCLTQNLQLETVDTIRQYPKTDTVSG